MSAVNSESAVAIRRRKTAIAWVTRTLVDDRDLPPLTRWKWQRWRADPENQRAFDEAAALWRKMGDVPRLTTAPPANRSVPSRSIIGTRGWKIAAAVGVVTIAALLVPVARDVFLIRTIETGASEWREQVLTDGSIVKLGPRTLLRTQFDDEHRSVRLLHGEAYFAVVRDPARQFVVSTELAAARALGTAFSVSRVDGETIVTVARGAVDVSRSQPAAMSGRGAARRSSSAVASVVLSAGEQASVPASGPVTKTKVDLEQALAWASGRLVFGSGTRVIDAVQEFNRRNRVQIEVVDWTAAPPTISGAFDANDPESFARLLSSVTHLIVVRDTPGVLRLEPDPTADHVQTAEANTAQVTPE